MLEKRNELLKRLNKNKMMINGHVHLFILHHKAGDKEVPCDMPTEPKEAFLTTVVGQQPSTKGLE